MPGPHLCKSTTCLDSGLHRTHAQGCCTRPSATVPSLLSLQESGTCYQRRTRHCRHFRLSSVHWRRNFFTDRTTTTTHTAGNSYIDISLIRDICCGPEVLFETCVAMKFVDDGDDMAEDFSFHTLMNTSWYCCGVSEMPMFSVNAATYFLIYLLVTGSSWLRV